MKYHLYIFFLLMLTACGGGSNEQSPEVDNITPPEPVITELYFPPVNTDFWETTTATEIGWNTTEITNLISLLESNGTRAFIVLKDGRIVIEEYFGLKLNGTEPFDSESNWYWASAGKTLTAFMIGQAQQDGFLSLSDTTTQYLGENWSSLLPEQEQAITILNQLTMTSGLDDSVVDDNCTLPECLVFLAEPNLRWAYHNAPYTLLTQVIESAAGQSFTDYFNNALRDRVGMNGFWLTGQNTFNEVYYSTGRSMARFGLLMLNDGVWNETVLLNDQNYINSMTNSSQDLNPAYGYLWWLNGKDRFMVPATGQQQFNGSITPNAPDDMFSAIGKNGQVINIIPSRNIVMIRMGDSSDDARVAIQVQNQIWEVFQRVID